MSTKAERDIRLAKLTKATTDWADKRLKQYQDRVTSNKALLKGRTGADRLAQANVQAGSVLVVNALSEFLLI